MKVKSMKRFNGKDAGTVFEAKDADAKKWIGMGIAAKATKADEAAAEKGVDGPPKDKAEKSEDAKTK